MSYTIDVPITSLSICLTFFAYNRNDKLTDKMSNSDERFDILRDIKPYNFETFAKKVTNGINCEELIIIMAAMAVL